jgi:DNA-binding MarR family transcriptional regulator
MSLPTRSSALTDGSASVPGEAVDEHDGLEAWLVATIPPVMRHLLAHARRRPSWAELTYQQYNVLRIIQAEGPMAQGEIARRLLVSAPVITRQASALAESGLVERRPDTEDRRSVRLALTTRGRRRVKAMRAELLDGARELLAPLPEEQRRNLAVALERLQVLLPSQHARSTRSPQAQQKATRTPAVTEAKVKAG